MEAEIQKFQELLDYNDKVIKALMERMRDLSRIAQETTLLAIDNDIDFSAIVKEEYNNEGTIVDESETYAGSVRNQYIPQELYTSLKNEKLNESGVNNSNPPVFKSELPSGFNSYIRSKKEILNTTPADENCVIIGQKYYPFIQSEI